jgi:hypothetical protein
MKTLIYPAIASLFIVVACKKEENVMSELNSSYTIKPSLRAGATRFLCRDFHGTSHTFTWECYIPGNNCFEPVTVTPRLSNLINLIENNENQIEYFQSNNYSDVLNINIFDQDIQDGLENGNLHMIIKRNSECLVYIIIIDPIYNSDEDVETKALLVSPVRLC